MIKRLVRPCNGLAIFASVLGIPLTAANAGCANIGNFHVCIYYIYGEWEVWISEGNFTVSG